MRFCQVCSGVVVLGQEYEPAVLPLDADDAVGRPRGHVEPLPSIGGHSEGGDVRQAGSRRAGPAVLVPVR